jgi:hypothetical protein
MTFLGIEIHAVQIRIRLQLRASRNRIINMPRIVYCFVPAFLM